MSSASVGAIGALIIGIIFAATAIIPPPNQQPEPLPCAIEARDPLLDSLASSQDRVNLAAPTVRKLERGETEAYSLSIRNNDVDNLTVFYVNVYLDEVGGGLNTTTLYQKEANSWLSWKPEVLSISPGGCDVVNITVQPRITAAPGIYGFRIAVCDSKPTDKPCHATSLSIPGFKIRSQELYDSELFTIEIPHLE